MAASAQQIVGRERRERVSQLAWCREGCFDSRRRVNSNVGRTTRISLMNRKQWTILLAGVVLLGVSELFPPWVYEDENTSVRRSAGYHLFNRPPKLKSAAEMRTIFSLQPSEPIKFMWVHVNGVRLLSQRLFLIAATPGLVFALANQRSLIKILLAIAFLIAALCFLGVFAFDVWAMR